MFFPYKNQFNKTASTGTPIDLFSDNNIPLFAVLKLNDVSSLRNQTAITQNLHSPLTKNNQNKHVKNFVFLPKTN